VAAPTAIRWVGLPAWGLELWPVCYPYDSFLWPSCAGEMPKGFRKRVGEPVGSIAGRLGWALTASRVILGGNKASRRARCR